VIARSDEPGLYHTQGYDLCADEADRMLDMGLSRYQAYHRILPAKSNLFFSATMPPEIVNWR
jgi:superfamily II DNA/RNA helicase